MKSNPLKNVLASTVLALIVTAPAISFGLSQGGTDGGGGNAIVCFKDKAIPKRIYADGNPQKGVITDEMLKSISSVETYDYAYAKLATLERTPTIVQIQEGEAFDAYAVRIANRIMPDAPEVGWLVNQGLALLKFQKALIRQNGVITVSDIADVGVVDQESCVVATMAVQVLGGPNPLNLDSRLFNHPSHSRQSKAILILHEILYAAARYHFKVEDSSGVRELIRMITTEGAGNSRAELTALMKSKFMSSFETVEGNPGSKWLPQTAILFNAVAPLTREAVKKQENFYLALPDSKKNVGYNSVNKLTIFKCAPDADLQKNLKAYIGHGEPKEEACEFSNGFYGDFIKETLSDVKFLALELNVNFQSYQRKIEVETLWKNGVQAQMEKYRVRPEAQEQLKTLFTKTMASDKAFFRLYFGSAKENKFLFWNQLDQELRNSRIELP